MNRQLVSKAQKPKSSTLLSPTDILQHKAISRTDLGASTVDTRCTSEQQIDKSRLPGVETHFSHGFSKIPVRLNSPGPIQAKLKIGQPNDQYEQEADRVAEQVMRMPEPQQTSSVDDSSLIYSAIPNYGAIQRSCDSCSEEYKKAENEGRPVESTNLCPKCLTQEGLIQTKQITPLIQRQDSPEEEEEEELIQAKTTGGVTLEVTPEINSGIQSLKSGGRPLSESERSFFEPRFGADFSNVRVHLDSQAIQTAKDINARAYTVGNNIVFGLGEYTPEHSSGRRLMAHELTHVFQQQHLTPRMREVQRKPKKKKSVNVWGLNVHKGMCGCIADIKSEIKWTRTAAKAYKDCDKPVNKTGTDVEACFNVKIPGTMTVGTTSAGGKVTLPPPSANPCKQVENKAIAVHETSHARHTDRLARKRGKAFYKEWWKLKGDPDRLNKMKAKFPAETAEHEKAFNEGSDWAKDEVRAYRFQRRFLQAASRALRHKIC